MWEKSLEGFNWRTKEKPSKEQVLARANRLQKEVPTSRSKPPIAKSGKIATPPLLKIRGI